MTQQHDRSKPPILSKEERARERAALDSSVPDPVDGGDSPLDDVRQQALSMGYVLRRESRPRRARPREQSGRVPTTCRIHPGIRAAMDQARVELNLTHADMINAGVLMFLESQGLRVDVDVQEFYPPAA